MIGVILSPTYIILCQSDEVEEIAKDIELESLYPCPSRRCMFPQLRAD